MDGCATRRHRAVARVTGALHAAVEPRRAGVRPRLEEVACEEVGERRASVGVGAGARVRERGREREHARERAKTAARWKRWNRRTAVVVVVLVPERAAPAAAREQFVVAAVRADPLLLSRGHPQPGRGEVRVDVCFRARAGRA
jgi:hypothetical protein